MPEIYRTIQIRLKLDELERQGLEFICQQANSLVNCSVYAVRQGYFMLGGTGMVRPDYPSLDVWMKQLENPHYRGVAAQAAQQVLKGVVESFSSFDKLLEKFWQGDVEKPKLPGYRKKGGLAAISFPAQALQFDIETGLCRLPLGKIASLESGIDSIWVQGAWVIKIEQISEVRILPRNGEFYAEYVYKATGLQAKYNLDPTQALGIDHGVGNWLTCVSSLGKSFIIDGYKVKSVNQLYNKRVATLKTGKNRNYWDTELARLSEKRNRQMRDAVNKTARFIVNHCLANSLGTVVFGWNEGNKDGASMGKKNNQEFVQIPTARLKQRIQELCEEYGIQFVETEESYTSKASFLDGDELPTFGEKPEWYKPSGKRVKRACFPGEASPGNTARGMYRTAAGFLINADCNGAANILKKVSIQLGLDLAKVCRGVLNLPQRYNLFSSLTKSYRRRSEAARFQPAA